MSIDPQSLARLSFTVDAGAKTLDIGVKAPFKMWLPDPSAAGSFVHKTITAPATINGDGHASENFNTGEVGQTLGRDWLSDYPITWYITILDGVTYWVCSRNPCMTQMPAAAGYIGDFSAEPATATTLQTNVFIAASVTVADFVDLPVWPIGTMPVQRAAASQIPTLQALTAGQDGAGLWNEATKWTMPAAQNGADTGKYFLKNGGDTAPAFTSNIRDYRVRRDGSVTERAIFGTATAGSGATAAKLALSHTSTGSSYGDMGYVLETATNVMSTLEIVGAALFAYMISGAASATSDTQLAGTHLSITYQAFEN